MSPLSSVLRHALAPLGISILTITLAARVVTAQSGGANEWSLDSTLAQHLVSAPAPGTWAAAGTVGAQFSAGRTETRGYDLDLIVARSTRAKMLLRLDAEWRRADARLRPNEPIAILDDTRFLALSAIPRLSDRFGVLVTTSWRQDVRAGLDSRTMAQVGPYWQAIATKQVQLSLTPFAGVGVQDNVRPTGSQGIEAYGGIATLTWRLNPMTMLEAYASGHRVLRDAKDHSLQTNASITSMLSKHLALKVAYNAAHEGIVPLGGEPRQHSLTTGLTVAFPRLGEAP